MACVRVCGCVGVSGVCVSGVCEREWVCVSVLFPVARALQAII